MGALCCCPCIDEYEEHSYSGNSIYRNCICLRFFFHQLLSGYGAMFHRLEGRSVSPTQGGTSLASTGSGTGLPDNSVNDTPLSSSRPVPYDTEQRYARLQRDGLVSRKSMTHFLEESQSLRRNISSSGVESLGFGKKRNGVDFEDDNKLGCSESSEKALATKVAYGLTYVQPYSEDEDFCPTCLDEYTPENPKITTRCSHHFHLGCIYEWLERSDSCPICGKDDVLAMVLHHRWEPLIKTSLCGGLNIPFVSGNPRCGYDANVKGHGTSCKMWRYCHGKRILQRSSLIEYLVIFELYA